MSEWIEYTGSTEQIAEIEASFLESGFIVKKDGGSISDVIQGKQPLCEGFVSYNFEISWGVNSYLICQRHPLADMICQQAKTGQPVWIKCKESYHIHRTPYDEVHWTGLNNIYKTVTPDWNIPNAEYAFTEFKEEV